jgi:hypothetical protein
MDCADSRAAATEVVMFHRQEHYRTGLSRHHVVREQPG